MKMLRFTFAAAIALAFGNAYAFHSGGVAECSGCHSMHAPAAGGANLLVGVDNSSTCLTCHEHAGDTGPSSYHISTAETDMAGKAPLQRTPGGDFGWLKKTYSFVLRNSTITNDGQTHGHNIIAATNNYKVDGVNATAPGGTFPSAKLACSSCHDPHGKYRRLADGSVVTTGGVIVGSGSYDTSVGNGGAALGTGEAVGVYRLLGGAGFANSTTDGASFTGSPVAVAPATYNRTEAATDTRVAYGVGTATGSVAWGRWCGTCHGNMHSNNGSKYVHPTDQTLGSTVALNYGNYVKTGDMTGAGVGSGYSSLVPYAENTNSYTTLASHAKNTAVAALPASTDQVMCLSCHRAHASGFREMLRWNMEGEMITYAGAWPDVANASSSKFSDGLPGADVLAAYYDRPATNFATYQRVLCNKCHAKD